MANAGTFKKGDPRAGRPKGTLNKNTQLIREMVAQALDDAGGVAYLVEQAKEKPAAFLALVGKVLPIQVEGTDAPIKHSIKILFE